MATYLYIKAASGTMEFHRQKYGMYEYLASMNIGNLETLSEVVAGTLEDSGKILIIVDQMRPGDHFITSDIVNFGSTSEEVVEALTAIAMKDIQIHIVNAGLTFKRNDAQAVMAVWALMAQIEKHLISASETSKAPVRAAVSHSPDADPTATSSLRTRRSQLDGYENFLKSMLDEGFTFADISRRTGWNRQTIKDFLVSRNLLH